MLHDQAKSRKQLFSVDRSALVFVNMQPDLVADKMNMFANRQRMISCNRKDLLTFLQKKRRMEERIKGCRLSTTGAPPGSDLQTKHAKTLG